MIRVAAMLLTAALLFGSLISCSGSNLVGLTGDELRGYTAMKTEHFEITGSMYAYFFLEIGSTYVSGITQEELDERGFDENKTLRDQKYDKSRTWYEYIGEYVNTEVENLLLLCEAATEAGITLTNDDYNYVNNQLTNIRMQIVVQYQTDYNTYLGDRYFGYVNEEDMKKIFLMETLATKYSSYMDTEIEEKMTQERVDAHLETMTFENGRDETITRNLGHVMSTYDLYDEDQAYENMMTVLKRYEESGKSLSTLTSLWKELSDDANMIYENLSQGDMVEKIDKWLYAEGRAVGDVGILTTDDGCHFVTYLSEGDPVYVAQAKTELHEIIAEEIMEGHRAKFKITAKKNVLNAIDV